MALRSSYHHRRFPGKKVRHYRCRSRGIDCTHRSLFPNGSIELEDFRLELEGILGGSSPCYPLVCNWFCSRLVSDNDHEKCSSELFDHLIGYRAIDLDRSPRADSNII